MADGIPRSSEPYTEREEPSQPREEIIQLRFPTIDLKTSLDSLLTHSYPSSQASTTMPAADNPTPALDESWASLSASDYFHEDDLQSENTDAESLVDLSSTQDTESVVEEDEQSEHGVEEARQNSIVPISHNAKGVEPVEEEKVEQHLEEAMDDTIILRASEDQLSAAWTHLEYACAAPVRPISVSSTGLHKINQQEVIHMNVSNESLSTSDKPFHIACYGIGSARVSREELLGKIGAALISSTPKNDTSECYNILPTEFGPGSKPAFAELIPSQPQMAVDNLTILKHAPNQPKSIRFASKQGRIIESKPAVSAYPSNQEQWRPDLLLVQLCRDDLADDFYTARQVTELAKRHCWPALVISQDSAAGLYPALYPHSLFKKIEIHTVEGPQIVKHPIDLDNFLRIDTDQLNKHIRYIISMAEMRQHVLRPHINLVIQLKNKVSRFLQLPDTTAQLDRYVLETVESSEKSIAQQRESTFMEGLKQCFMRLDYQKLLRDIAGSLAMMLIGFFLVFIYQNLPESICKMGSHPFSGPDLPISSGFTSTVTATSALPLTTTALSALSGENAVGSLDHMLHRLIGKPKVEEVEMPEEIASMTALKEHAEPQVMQGDALVRVVGKVESFLSGLSIKLEAAQDHLNENGKKFKSSRRAARERNREQMQHVHVKLQGFWDDMLKGVHDLSQQSHDSFAELVAQSQNLLAQSRKVGGQRLEKLVRDQKTLLFKAQKQAQNIFERPKKPTRKLSLLNRARAFLVD